MSTHLFDISCDIIRQIYYLLDTKTQIILKQTCKYFNMFSIVVIDEYAGHRITDEILLNYPSLIELHINFNNKITDKGLQYLSLLQLLDARGTEITYKGIKHLHLLRELHTSGDKINWLENDDDEY